MLNISIITTVLNGEEFIESCIQNVIDQKFGSCEHIIVDGGSEDKTVEIIQDYANRYPHIKWISEEDNGQSEALNKGIKMAQGEILGVLDYDDFYQPGLLAKISAIFKKKPDLNFIIGNTKIWHHNSRVSIEKPRNIDLVKVLSYRRLPSSPSSYFFRKSLQQKVGLYKISEHYLMDIDFILRALLITPIVHFDEVWGNRRHHKCTKTFLHQKTGNRETYMEQFFQEFMKSLPLLTKFKVFNCRLANLILRTTNRGIKNFKATIQKNIKD